MAGFAITVFSVKSVTVPNSGKDLYCAQYVTRQTTIGVYNLNLLKCPNVAGNVRIVSSAELVGLRNFLALKILKTKLILTQIKNTLLALILNSVSNAVKTSTGSLFAKFARRKLDLV